MKKGAGEKPHNQEPIEIDPEVTEMIELADRYFKTAVVNMAHVHTHNEE